MSPSLRLLRHRKANPEPFQGSYQAVDVAGSARDHILAFARQTEEQVLVTVVPRFPVRLRQSRGLGEAHLTLPKPGRWTELLSGSALQTDDALLAQRSLPLPWAVLLHEPSAPTDRAAPLPGT